MTDITENTFLKDPTGSIQRLLKDNQIIKVVSDNKSFVIIDETEWKNIEETTYLNSIKGYPESIIESSKEDLNSSLNVDDLDW